MGSGNSKFSQAAQLRALDEQLPMYSEILAYISAAYPHVLKAPRTAQEVEVADFVAELLRLQQIRENLDRFTLKRLFLQWEFVERALNALPAVVLPPVARAAG